MAEGAQGNKKKYIIIGGITIVVLALFGAGAYILLKKKEPEQGGSQGGAQGGAP